jgi:4-hydroxy-3-methylbut-2-enyl diphosphate reductase
LGYDIIYIGTKNHQESKGTLGRLDKSKFYVVESEEDIKNLSFSDSDKIAYVSQTTLNVDKVAKIIKKIKEVLPNIVGNDLNDICSATKNRQAALKNIISNYDIDLVLVIGSKISSNSNKLVEVGGSFLSDSNDLQNKRSSFLIENYKDIDDSWMCGVKNIVLTAGASAPKILIDETINYLRDKFNVAVEEVMYLQERTKFYPPKAFRELEKEYLSQNN